MKPSRLISQKEYRERVHVRIEAGEVPLTDEHRRAAVVIGSTKWASVRDVAKELNISISKAWLLILSLKAHGIVRTVPRDVNALVLAPDISIIAGDICRAIPLENS